MSKTVNGDKQELVFTSDKADNLVVNGDRNKIAVYYDKASPRIIINGDKNVLCIFEINKPFSLIFNGDGNVLRLPSRYKPQLEPVKNLNSLISNYNDNGDGNVIKYDITYALTTPSWKHNRFYSTESCVARSVGETKVCFLSKVTPLVENQELQVGSMVFMIDSPEYKSNLFDYITSETVETEKFDNFYMLEVEKISPPHFFHAKIKKLPNSTQKVVLVPEVQSWHKSNFSYNELSKLSNNTTSDLKYFINDFNDLQSRKKEIEIIYKINTIRNIEYDGWVVKFIDKNYIDLSRNDCKVLGITYQENLKLFPNNDFFVVANYVGDKLVLKENYVQPSYQTQSYSPNRTTTNTGPK